MPCRKKQQSNSPPGGGMLSERVEPGGGPPYVSRLPPAASRRHILSLWASCSAPLRHAALRGSVFRRRRAHPGASGCVQRPAPPPPPTPPPPAQVARVAQRRPLEEERRPRRGRDEVAVPVFCTVPVPYAAQRYPVPPTPPLPTARSSSALVAALALP